CSCPDYNYGTIDYW
nr:immunoglobulin heavy chain junction region [Macaca mulatta]